MPAEVLTVEGASLSWAESGQGEPLFLVHGLSETKQVWQQQVDFFARDFRVVALDVRGFGDSEVGHGDGDPAQFARDLTAVIRHVAPRGKAHIVSFSMGGVIAQRIAIDFPDLVAAVVIASSSSAINEAGESWFLERLQDAGRLGRAAFDEMNRSDAQAMVRGMPDEAGARYVELRVASVRDQAGYANACRAMASLRAKPLLGELGHIACPALVLTGELDPNCPPSAAASIHRRIPGSRLQLLPGVGHLSHWQDAAAFNRACLEFLRDPKRAGVAD